ncbi:hypothetical protein GCM10017562_59910 [Streptomyces roseofulvus]|uniref:hypothetical protein n=1 Tax=Streptomyces roseofulvus TaxID=33902 RepID=UPI0031FE0709
MSHDGMFNAQFDSIVRNLGKEEADTATTAGLVPAEPAFPPSPLDDLSSTVTPLAPLPPLSGLVIPGGPVPTAPQGRRSLLARAREWVVSRTGIQTLGVSLGTPSLALLIGEVSAAHSQGWTGAASAALLLGGGALGIASLKHHWGNGAVLTGCGSGILGLQLAMSAASSPWLAFTGWVLGAAASGGARIAYANGRKKPEAEVRILAAEAQRREAAVLTEQYRAAAQLHRAQLEQIRVHVALTAAVPAPQVHHGLSYTPVLRGDETGAETALMYALTPGRWADTAPERGLDGTSVVSCRLTDSGIVLELRLNGRWDPAKLAAQEGQVRALASVPTATRVQIGPGALGDTATVLIRTRSASDGMSTEWAPGKPGIGVVVSTGEVFDIPVEGVHSMTGGRTNMGKSAYARIQLMRTVADPLRAGIVIDPKRAEAVAWAGKLRTAGEAADPEERWEEIYALLKELLAEFRHRQTLFPGLYWEASEEYPTLFITLDEGAALKRMAEFERVAEGGKKYKPFEDAPSIAETLYGEARVVGMWFNWASQYLAKGTSIPQLVKENVGATVGLTTLGAEGDRMLFGEEAGRKGWSPSELCKGIPGRALVKYMDSEPEPVQLWHVTGDHIAALPDAEPWRSKAPAVLAERRRQAVADMPAEDRRAATAADAADLKARILAYAEEHPEASPGAIADALGVGRTTVRRALGTTS